MNYIKHLTGFFDAVSAEEELTPAHVSLYVALFQYWNINRFTNPIYVSRSELMRVSRIGSSSTYHKIMRELHELGYIWYEPSYNPFRGSAVYLVDFEDDDWWAFDDLGAPSTSNEPVVDSHHIENQQSTNQLNEPYINNTNNTNSKHIKREHKTGSNLEQVENKTSNDTDVLDETHTGGSGARPGSPPRNRRPGSKPQAGPIAKPIDGSNGGLVPPKLEAVKVYFAAQKSTATEAERFFNYFESNGWRVGGKSPMMNWRAAARNWILNSGKFGNENRSQLHTTTDKNYDEAL
jgi:hypothetical protein